MNLPKRSLLDQLKIIIPFSYMWFLRRSIGDAKTILDLGCGDGDLTAVVAQDKDWQITGVDIYGSSLKKAKEKMIYEKLIRGDILKVAINLAKEKRKFDVVFFSQVIEHISKSKGEKVLNVIEKLAKKRIVVGTPRGFMEQPEQFLQGNPHQVHHSGWEEDDFKKLGYKVYGIGLAPIWSESGLARTKNKFNLVIMTLFAYILSPVVYYFPHLGAGILCIKEKKK